MPDPKISVLMPTRDAAKYLSEAVESILKQSFTNFEFIIVDDGSLDDTVKIIEAFRDERISIFKRPRKGLSAALNYGIKEARGQYIARMDADDIAMPYRFEKQAAYLDDNPDIGVCGTIFQEFMHGDLLHDHMEHVRYADLLYGCYIGHPTVMFRREFFIEHGLFYDESLKYSEDYELWGRVGRLTRIGNVQENLLRYRRHAQSISAVNAREMAELDRNIRIAMIEYLVDGLTAQERKTLELILDKAPLEDEPAERLTTNLLARLRRPELCSALELFAFLKSRYSFSAEFTERILETGLAELPVFVLSFNRLNCLRSLLNFFEEYSIKNVHIIDNHSNNPDLIEYLQKVPFTVHYLDKNHGHMALFEQERFRDIIDNSYFVLTDPDILPVEQCPADFLRVFLELLLGHPRKNKVGFSLKIDDLPRHYELRENVLAWERRFYANSFTFKGLTLYDAPLDTTFALYRPRSQWRAKDFYAALRVGRPYEARHLPWYQDLSRPDKEELYYRAADAGCGNWNGRFSSAELHGKLDTRPQALFAGLFERIHAFLFMDKTARPAGSAGEQPAGCFTRRLLEKRPLADGAGFYLFGKIPVISKKASGRERYRAVTFLFNKIALFSKRSSQYETHYKLFDRFVFYRARNKFKALCLGGFTVFSRSKYVDSGERLVWSLFDALPLCSKTTVAGQVRYKLFDKLALPVLNLNKRSIT